MAPGHGLGPTRSAGLRLALTALTSMACVACGKKGPPLAPLYLVPSAVTEVSARRLPDAVRLRFVLPTQNQNGPGINLDRVEIYAVTVAPGAETPPNRELLTRRYLAGEVAVEPPAVEGAAPVEDDPRPAPGEVAAFSEALTEKVLEPAVTKAPVTVQPGGKPPPPVPGPPLVLDPLTRLPLVPLQTKPGWPDGALGPGQTVRVYVIRGVARNGRPGPPSPRVQIPLGAVPGTPTAVIARHTETAVVVEWMPVAPAMGEGALRYHLYRADALDDPITRSPLTGPSHEQAGAPLGSELCFRVRAVDVRGPVAIESGLSDPVCLTPTDVFPPAAPKGLAPVATPGAVQLIWDANTEADLAGYLVLRGEGAGETLQPLTPAPIKETVYRDTGVQPGVRYVYAIVAVDSATPANRSTPSERAEVVAR